MAGMDYIHLCSKCRQEKRGILYWSLLLGWHFICHDCAGIKKAE